MARRITGPGDIAIINSELKRLDLLQSQLADATSRIGELEKHTQQIRDTRGIPAVNNLVFTWTGGTLTLSWATGYVQDNSLNNYPVIAGSLVLVASTTYWLAWNPLHHKMAFNTSLISLLAGPGLAQADATVGGSNVSYGNNLVICSVYTGTSGQSGTAGGGGSDPGGTGPNGRSYKDF